MHLAPGWTRHTLSAAIQEIRQMNTLFEFAIVAAWICVSVMALTRVFTERRRWQRQMSACDAMRMTSAKVRH